MGLSLLKLVRGTHASIHSISTASSSPSSQQASPQFTLQLLPIADTLLVTLARIKSVYRTWLETYVEICKLRNSVYEKSMCSSRLSRRAKFRRAFDQLLMRKIPLENSPFAIALPDILGKIDSWVISLENPMRKILKKERENMQESRVRT